MADSFVYRLKVEVPPESLTNPDWRPENWAEQVQRIGYDPLVGTEAETGAVVEAPWRWPRRRSFLSMSAANRQARRYRDSGATVVIEKSLPVVWP